MALQVVLQRCRHILSLRHYAHPGWHSLPQGVHQQRIVCATQYDGIYLRVLFQKLGYALSHKEVRPFAFCLARFHYGGPQRARLTVTVMSG